MKRIKLKGIKNPSKFEDAVDSSLIDIAYVETTIGGIITLSIDSEVEIKNTKDKEWILELVNMVLTECEETSAEVSFE
ncbi:MAG: hypothetical protein EOP56_03420 [Sphingobacteriales bacterium]|nr:MAG: hypothetical protein EOP56_03420 [Sphingobacteriales bacterium]